MSKARCTVAAPLRAIAVLWNDGLTVTTYGVSCFAIRVVVGIQGWFADGRRTESKALHPIHPRTLMPHPLSSKRRAVVKASAACLFWVVCVDSRRLDPWYVDTLCEQTPLVYTYLEAQ